MKSLPERTGRRVIKASRLVPRQSSGVDWRASAPAASVDSAQAGDHILQVARQVARATIAVAQRDAEQIRKTAEREARRHGFEQGKQRGYTEGIREAEADARRILENAERAAREIMAQAEEQVGNLACEVAAHLLGVEIRLNPEVVERAVLAVLQESVPTGPVSIEVAPADYPRALEALPKFRAALGGDTADIRVVEDAGLPQGGFRVSGPHGVVERNWREGLIAVSDAFEEVARHGL